MSPFAALLDLQAHDTATDQHRHRRANLPERGAIVSADRAIAAIDADIATISTERTGGPRSEALRGRGRCRR